MSRNLKKIAFLIVVLLFFALAGSDVFADGAAIPPGDIFDLAAVTAGSTSVQLTWSASGADGYSERATAYDMRYSTANFTSAMWNSLTRASGTPVPGEPRAPESFTLAGLSPSTKYYAAVRGVDSFGTLSQTYNIASFTTTAGGSSTVTNVMFTLRLEAVAVPSSKSVTITFFTAGTLNSPGTFTATTDSSGRVALPGTLALPGGLYDILFASPTYLRVKMFEYNLSSNATVLLPILQAGDLNNDNIINSLDWGVMSGRWFSSDATADLNKDGIVNSLDWGVMSGNWFQTGN